MTEYLVEFLRSNGYMPHGYCYSWDRGLVALHVLSDTLIALAYFSIPITLFYFARKRRDVPFNWMFLCFGLFIVACGATHVMEVWTLWHANYWASGVVKAVTALASVPTAVLLVRLMPKAISLPSPAQLEEINEQLRHHSEQLATKNQELSSLNATLRETQARYRLLFDSNPQPIWVYDLETLGMLDANHAASHHYGYSDDEFLNLTIKDLRPPEEVPTLLRDITTSPADAIHRGFWKHRTKTGEIREVEVISHPLCYAGKAARLVVANDVTERRAAERALQSSEEKFRSLVQTATDAIVTTDADGVVIDFNRAAEEIFGAASTKVVGGVFTDLIPERFHRKFVLALRHWRRAGCSGPPNKPIEITGRRKDGTEFSAELSLARWSTRESLYFTGILSDITARKRAEQEVRRRSTELEALNRELESFSYSVSHDLRAPLRAIDGFSQALLDDYSNRLDDTAKDYLRRVRMGAQRMGMLIDDLLNLSRVTRAEMHSERVDLSALAEEVASELRNESPDRSVDFRIQNGLEDNADARLLRIALQNLLSNAWKFTSKRAQGLIQFGKMKTETGLAYFVSDNGAGFDPNYAQRLFGAFQRLHPTAEFPGTGIGLATVQRIVHRHGGAVWADGSVGHGATFYFTLAAS